MTRLLFTFQEASPLITYNGGWVEGSPTNDSMASSYNGSFRVTFTAGATASFTFSGTAVSLFGALRANHGNYTVKLDQQPLFEAVGSSPVDAFNHSLWNADNLGYTQHSVTLTNVPTSGPFLDLDFVSIERQIGQDGDTIFSTTFDDSSSAVQYSGSWEQTMGHSTAYQATLHTTEVANSQAKITFQGCCVELYGQYANAPYSVTLDNQPPVNMTGLDVDLTEDFQHPQTLLYLVDGLSEGNHTVTLTNVNSNVNRPFFFDYAIVRSTKNITSNGTAPPPALPSAGLQHEADSSNSTHVPVGAIAGASVGGMVILLAFLVVGFLFIRRRRRLNAKNSYQLDLIDESELEPKPFVLPNHQMQGTYPDQEFPATLGPGGFVRPSKQHQVADYYPQSAFASEEGLLSPQERSSAAGGSESYPVASSTSTGITMSSTSTTTSPTSTTMSPGSASRTASSIPRRDTKSGAVSFSQHTTGESVEDAAVQEEDAGVVIPPEHAPVARTLPPAYNPEWHQREAP